MCTVKPVSLAAEKLIPFNLSGCSEAAEINILGILPVFWIFAGLFFVYFILVFQVFTFENGLSPVGYFKRSMFLIKGKFGRTFLLMAILTIFTYVILVSGLGVLFDAFNLFRNFF